MTYDARDEKDIKLGGHLGREVRCGNWILIKKIFFSKV
jgi:hypothetical protein